jgi:uncharacterized protein
MQKSFDRASGKYYHARLMSNEIVIDSISFAKKSESLQGKIAVGSLERVRESLASSQGEVEFRLQGKLDIQRRPNLILSISGQLALTCQRCLGDFVYELTLERRMVLVTSEAMLPDLDDEDPDVDFVLADSKMNVQELIEDEIILGLPVAPKHDYLCIEIDADGMTNSFGAFAKLGKPN